MYLRGECLEKFVRFGKIPDWSNKRIVFVFGEDETGNYQACAEADGFVYGIYDFDQLAAIAIARCNEFGARWGINCKLFAVENEIVWGKEEDVEFK